MAAAGIYGGYFAGALGVIMLATLAMATADDLRRLNALKAALSLVNSTVTLLVFAAFGPVHWPAGGCRGADHSGSADTSVPGWPGGCTRKCFGGRW